MYSIWLAITLAVFCMLSHVAIRNPMYVMYTCILIDRCTLFTVGHAHTYMY